MKETNFKQTEIGSIPKDWEVKDLEKLLIICNGADYKHLGQGEVPVYGTGGLLANVDDYLYDGETICIGRKGTIDKPQFHKGKIWTVDTLFYTKIYGALPLFLYYKTLMVDWQSINEATGVPSLTSKNIYQVKVSLPPTKEEQEKIATALQDTDNLISALDKLIAKKQAIKQGAMQELLTGKKRLKGFDGEWEYYELGKVSDIYRGGSPRPIEAFLTTNPNGINWIKIGDVGVNAKYIESTAEKITQNGIAHSRVVYPGDFLLSNSMSFGRPYILKIKGCIHDGWLVIQKYQDTFNIEFLYYQLSSEETMAQYKTLAAGSSVLNLNKEIVSKVIIKAPKIDEQRAIAEILSNMDAEIEALQQKRDKYAAIKEGMMQELLTGKIRLI